MKNNSYSFITFLTYIKKGNKWVIAPECSDKWEGLNENEVLYIADMEGYDGHICKEDFAKPGKVIKRYFETGKSFDGLKYAVGFILVRE